MRISAGLLVALVACSSTSGDAGPDPVVTDAGQVDAGDLPDAGTSTTPFVFNGECQPLGAHFCAANPLPFASTVNAIDARAEDDVWLVGKGTLLAHWNGTRFEVHDFSEAADFTSVDATEADCAWAVGGAVVARWDGQRWTSVQPPSETGLDRVVAQDCDHPLVYRRYGTTVHRWSGTSWEPFLTATEMSPPLREITALGADGTRVWVAGVGDRVRAYEQVGDAFIDRTGDTELWPVSSFAFPSGRVAAIAWDGMFTWEDETWRLDAWPSPLLGVAVDAKGQAYGLLQTTAARLEGTTITPLGPSLFRPVYGGDFQLSALSVTPAGTVWVGGQRGEVARHRQGAWQVFSEGPIWSRHSGARVGDELWTVGAIGLTVLEKDRVTFRDLTPEGSASEYFTIAAPAPDDVWLGGYEFTAQRPVLHWDGHEFVGEQLPFGLPQVRSLLRVGEEWWAVSRFIRVPTSSGVVARDAGGAWRSEQSGPDHAFLAGWTDGTRVITVGLQKQGEPDLYALAGPDVEHLWAVSQRALHRFDGQSWPVVHGFDDSMQALSSIVVREDDVYALGLRGTPSDTTASLVRWRDGGVDEWLVPGLPQGTGLFLVDDTLWIAGVDGAIVKVLVP